MPRFLLCLLLLSAISVAPVRMFADDRPNVLVIMADDLGFSDIGCYGSEIETPHLDSLASGGMRFSQFYNTAKCHSSRVSLLTGQYCLAAGDVGLSHAITSAEVLRSSGYTTMMTGKWHLDRQPTDFGFDRYFGHLSGATNYFRGDNSFRLDGQPWKVPKQDFYTTVADVDFGLQFLRDADKSPDPWYLYVAFNAPHAPLQALPDDYAKYDGRYDAGWDAIRAARLKKQRDLAIFASDLKPSPRPDHIPAWNTLSPARQQFESKRMTTLAAMIDRLDQEVGRLVAYLKDTGQLDNTMILFVSDNGACPYDRRSNHIDAKPTSGSVNWSDSTGWAWARNSPFRYYKQNQFEGGIATPAIVHWPAGLKTQPGVIEHQVAHLIDVMPTLADVTGSPIPTSYGDRELRPISGQSLRPIFEGKSLDRIQPLHFLFQSDRGLRIDDWKAVSFRGAPWELYDLKNDRSELNNLAASQPERLRAMVEYMDQDVSRSPACQRKNSSPSHLKVHTPSSSRMDQLCTRSGRRCQRECKETRQGNNVAALGIVSNKNRIGGILPPVFLQTERRQDAADTASPKTHFGTKPSSSRFDRLDSSHANKRKPMCF